MTDMTTAERVARRRKVLKAVEEVHDLAYAVLVADNYLDEELRMLRDMLKLLTEEVEGK